MLRGLIIAILILSTLVARGADSDTLSLSYTEFIKIVLANHPVSKQSDLLLERGRQSVKAGKGAFDPELNIEYDQKSFDGKNYYQINNNELSLNSRFGVKFRGGYENNSGEFLNPESTVPSSGLVYAGLTVPLGKGLLFDERRYALNQAEVYLQSTEIEKQRMINGLVLNAAKAYWGWFTQWKAFEIQTNAVDLAETRFLGIKQRFLQGDVPAIDTLEAFIQLQNRIVMRTSAMGQLQKSRAQLSNYFWSEDQQPLDLSEKVVPDGQLKESTDILVSAEELLNLIDVASSSHPDLGLYDNKLSSLEFDRKLAVESLKPKLNLSYNFLSEPVQGNNEFFAANNYKFGFKFGMPLFLREARGKLAVSKVKIDQVELQRNTAKQKITNDIQGIYSELIATQNQLKVYRDVVNNYAGLLAGERQKFISGESSVFLINNRENSLIESEIKLYQLFAKLQELEVKLAYAVGDTLVFQ